MGVTLIIPASGRGYESLIWLGGARHDDCEGVATCAMRFVVSFCEEERLFGRKRGEERLSIALWKLSSCDSGQKASVFGVTKSWLEDSTGCKSSGVFPRPPCL